MKRQLVVVSGIVISIYFILFVFLSQEEREYIPKSMVEDIHEPNRFRVATIFDHHMVLQQKTKESSIWGWCDENDNICKVNLILNDQIYFAKTELESEHVFGNSTTLQKKWIIDLPSMNSGGPYILDIYDSREYHIVIEDVYFGEVFFCGGQSNMLFTVGQTFTERKKSELFDYPLIRHFTLGRQDLLFSTNDAFPAEASWSLANEESIYDNEIWTHFSAVCWYFGKSLYEELDVPIGLINLSVNGSPLQTWVPPYIIDTCQGEPSRNPDMECCPTIDCSIWNGMVKPTIEYSAKGVIFYQGESNMYGPDFYVCAFPLFVDSWRKTAHNSDLQFYIIELAPMFYGRPYVPHFRDIQRKFTEEIDNVFIVQTTDLGDYSSPYGFLHPRKKEKIGDRARLSVLKHSYGYPIIDSGPKVEDIEYTMKNNQLEIIITYYTPSVGTGLVLKDFSCPTTDYHLETTPLEEYCTAFQIVFEDGNRTEIEPIIVDFNKIQLVKSFQDEDLQSNIFTVDFGNCGWPKAILYNSIGLPAVSFSLPLL